MVKILNMEDNNFDTELKNLVSKKRTFDTEIIKNVSKIISSIESAGDEALRSLTLQYDSFDIELEGLEVDVADLEIAYKNCNKELRKALHKSADRIYDFHIKQIPEDLEYTDNEEIFLGLKWNPLASIGLYVPGGTAAYPSSVLMLAIPAKVAKIKEVFMCVPCPNGTINNSVLVAAKIAGVDKIYKIGGAQAIAAMALGTKKIKPVDKIFGPGNAWVTEAKRQLFGKVGIDMIAGPSEILVIADQKNDPYWIAADLLSQAEHDESSQSILVTDHKDFAYKVINNVNKILKNLPRKNIAKISWDNNSFVLIVKSLDDAVRMANDIAPEHVEIATEKPELLSKHINNAGAIFLGRYTPEAIGDYIAGPNHVLPTSGSARFSSGLSTQDYMKRSTIMKCNEDSVFKIGKDAIKIANSEGLDAHVLSLELRTSNKL